MTKDFLEPTQASGTALFSRNISGEVVILNLLRFCDVADYPANPELAPSEAILARSITCHPGASLCL